MPVRPERNLGTNDVKAVWKALDRKYGLTPVYYKGLFGKNISKCYKKYLKFRCKVDGTDLLFDKNMQLFKHTMLSYKPMSGAVPALAEIMDATHEATHYEDMQAHPVSWYANYIKNQSFRATAEIKGYAAGASINYAMTGVLSGAYAKASIHRNYGLTIRNIRAFDAGLDEYIRGFEKIGRGATVGAASAIVVLTLIETGALKRV